MTTLFCWERDCLSVLKLKFMIKLNSLRSFLNIHVDYVLRSYVFYEPDQNEDNSKKKDNFSEFPLFQQKNSRHSRPLVVATFI